MPAWLLALLLKPLIGVAIVAAYYFGIVLPLRRAERRLPKNAFLRFLFRERGRQCVRPGAADPDKRLLD
jgi:hypothetical protein